MSAPMPPLATDAEVPKIPAFEVVENVGEPLGGLGEGVGFLVESVETCSELSKRCVAETCKGLLMGSSTGAAVGMQCK